MDNATTTRKRRPARAPIDRFWECVDKTAGGCWVWTGTMNERQPGCFYAHFYDGRKVVSAHRFSYELAHGPIGNLELHHVCKNTLCVNPDHLEPLDSKAHGATRRGGFRSICKRGHVLEGANVYTAPSGRRTCVACRHFRDGAKNGVSVKPRQHLTNEIEETAETILSKFDPDEIVVLMKVLQKRQALRRQEQSNVG